MASFGRIPDESGSYTSTSGIWNSCQRKKLLYRFLGVTAFFAACIPANIVAWVYLIQSHGSDDREVHPLSSVPVNATSTEPNEMDESVFLLSSNQTTSVRSTST